MGMETPGQGCVRGVGVGCSPGDGPRLPLGIHQDLRPCRSLGAPPGCVCLAAHLSLPWLHAGYFALPSCSSQAPALSPSLSLLISLSFRSPAWVLSPLAPR